RKGLAPKGFVPKGPAAALPGLTVVHATALRWAPCIRTFWAQTRSAYELISGSSYGEVFDVPSFPRFRKAALMEAGQILGRSGQPVLGSVSVAYVNALLDAAASNGADREALVADAGIDASWLLDPSWRLDLDGLLGLFDCARDA